MKVAILPVGNELLDGRVLDTNSKFLSGEISSLSGEVVCILSVPDELNTIVESLEFVSNKAEVIVITGGLGPTSDDLTREAVSEFANCPLIKNELLLNEIKEFFAKRGKEFHPSNEKQSFIPESSTVIPNTLGTAPGFLLRKESITIVSLPGVPEELEPMWLNFVKPLLKPDKELFVLGFKTFNLPESVVAGRIPKLEDVKIGYRAQFPEITVKISGFHKEKVENAFKVAKEAVGVDSIFTEDINLSLPDLFKDSKKTIQVAESCTGGLLGKLLTDLPGSSRYFLGGVISYSNELKEKLLGVRTIKDFGAVSSETAIAMAEGVRKKADVGISITGIAGPDGGTNEKPVGTFYIGVATEEGSKSYHFLYQGADRAKIRKAAAYEALNILRKIVL